MSRSQVEPGNKIRFCSTSRGARYELGDIGEVPKVTPDVI
jgi:hypothetical protein